MLQRDVDVSAPLKGEGVQILDRGILEEHNVRIVNISLSKHKVEFTVKGRSVFCFAGEGRSFDSQQDIDEAAKQAVSAYREAFSDE